MRDNKKIYAIAVVCVFLFVTCSFFWPTPAKKDLRNLRQNSQMVSDNLRTIEAEASKIESQLQSGNLQYAYNTFLGQLQESVNNVIVPTVDQSITILEITELSTPEVIALRDQLIYCLELYKEASEKMLLAIKTNDEAMLTEAETLLNQALSEADQYAISYKQLARKHGYIFFD